MNISIKTILATLTLALLGTFFNTSAYSAKQESETLFGDAYCLRCHGMKTLSYQDPQSGELVDLYIDENALPHASHGKEKCESCHKGDFEDYPHEIAQEKQAASCPDCHQDKPELKKYRFDKIAVQFEKSVHYQKEPDHFTCYTCHDLHTWQLSNGKQSTATLVDRNNGVCLNCHQARKVLKAPADKTPPPTIQEGHDWLPATGLHMESVRCLECHTPRPGSVIHAIEPARRAEKNCEACHTQDSILLTKLYKYRIEQNKRSAGFINGVVLNDNYIIGMTRHPILDLLGILTVALTGLGVAAHGLGRWIAARRRRDHENH
jgi:hypothetical protein